MKYLGLRSPGLRNFFCEKFLKALPPLPPPATPVQPIPPPTYLMYAPLALFKKIRLDQFFFLKADLS